MASILLGLRRLFGRRQQQLPPVTGSQVVLTGSAAVARTEELFGSMIQDNLARAMGLAQAGTRATVCLATADLQAAQSLLAQAAQSHLPLVVHLTLSQQDAYHGLADSGCLLLYGSTVQEVVDLSLVARRVAELALLPVVVAMDEQATARALQDVVLPESDLIHSFLGHSQDLIPSASPAQLMLFGEQRRRLPRAHDLARPALQNSLQGSESKGLALAGQAPFFLAPVAELLQQSFQDLAQVSGRQLSALQCHRLDDASLVLVAQGAAVETAMAVADHCRAQLRLRVGVLGLRCLRPLPLQEMQAALNDKMRPDAKLLVLQALTVGLCNGPALTAELRQVKPTAQMHSVVFGLGDLPLRAADLLALCQAAAQGLPPLLTLGVDFAPAKSSYPKRQVLLESMQRDYPQLAAQGLRAEDTTVDFCPAGVLGIAVHQKAGAAGEELTSAVASLLHNLLPGGLHSRLCSRLTASSPGYGLAGTDRLYLGDAELRDPGDGAMVDVAILTSPALADQLCLRQGGALLLCAEPAGLQLPPDITVYRIPQPAEHSVEEWLGGLVGLLQQRGIDLPTARASKARQDAPGFERGLAQLQQVTLPSVASTTGKSSDQERVPFAVRALLQEESVADSLPRFWDQVGVLYRHHDVAAELAPDPYLATANVPPLTATFRDFSSDRNTLPEFDASACTGCGDCWTACPDAALGPLALDFHGILQGGLAQVKATGGNADALTAVLSKLATRAKSSISGEAPPVTAGAALQPAFTWLMEKMAPPAERLASLTSAFAQVMQALGDLPLARTEAFYAAGSAGELFSLAINPDACKACQACVQVCEADALKDEAQNSQRLAAARKNWELWQHMPETSAATIQRVAADPEVGPAAALLLSRSCLLAMTGGDGAEAGSGEKLAMHLVMATAEKELQPQLQKQLEKLNQLQGQFAVKIKELLSVALPGQDLESLAGGLAELDPRHVDLADLTRKVEERSGSRPVDAAWLQRLVRTARQLQDLQQRLGRARLGLVVAQGSVAAWAGAFPYNPFSVPVTLDTSGEPGQLALGVAAAQLQAVMQDFRLLRRAELELQRPAQAEQAELDLQDLQSLDFQDLRAEERELCPPLLLVGGDDALGAKALSQLSALLSQDLPIKILVLTGLDDGHPDLGLLALAHRRAFVLQSSIAYPDHLVQGVQRALQFSGPALLHVYAPSPQRHGFAQSEALGQARAVVESRTLPLFCFDPAEQGVFGSRLTLLGNPAADALTPTLAHWAISQQRFADCFRPFTDQDGEAVELQAYLELPASQRQGKTPCIQDVVVDPAMVAACEDRLQSWQTLQELAGVVTPFTELAREAAVKDLAGQHAAELAAQRQDYEARLAQLREQVEQELTLRLQQRLVHLSDRYRQQSDTSKQSEASKQSGVSR